jgi:hypothetical protein
LGCDSENELDDCALPDDVMDIDTNEDENTVFKTL